MGSRILLLQHIHSTINPKITRHAYNQQYPDRACPVSAHYAHTDRAYPVSAGTKINGGKKSKGGKKSAKKGGKKSAKKGGKKSAKKQSRGRK